MSATPQEQLVLDGMNQRLERALAAFETVNEYAEGGKYSPPEDWRLAGLLKAVLALLVQLGLVTDGQLACLTAQAQVEVLEEALMEAREHLRQRTGVIVPVGPVGRPQG